MILSARLAAWCGPVLLGAAFLLPAGDPPWPGFWREWVASIAVLLIVLEALSNLRRQEVPLRLSIASLPTLAIGLALLCWIQLGAGQLQNLQDVLLPSLDFAAFGACIVVAASLPTADRDDLVNRLAAAMLGAAALSVPLAILQWLGFATLDLGIPVSGGRPVGSMEQANLLCSLLIMGALSGWRLIERGRIPPRLGAVLVAPVLMAAALTQSRVIWLLACAVVVVVGWRRDALPWRGRGGVLVAVVVAVVAGTLLLPWLDAHLGLRGAALSERVSPGRRPVIWALFLDSIDMHPWIGWGVLQNGAAQFAVAVRHPSAGYLMSSAHDVAIDLMVWFGAPIGFTAAIVLLISVVRRLFLARDAADIAAALVPAALLLHAAVEFPLSYAYFLLPFGLFLGACGPPPIDSGCHQFRIKLGGRIKLAATAIGPAVVLALLGNDYINATDVRPVLDIDRDTGHPMLAARLPAPDVVLLDGLWQFHVFAALPLQAGLGAETMSAARSAMLRLPYAPSIERYALLAGINGDASSATQALLRVCKYEIKNQCEATSIAWGQWRQRWPQLPRWPDAAAAD